MKKNTKHILALCFIIAIELMSTVYAQTRGIYVGGHFRRERSHTITDLKSSGFTYVILFNIQVEANGNLTTDGETICSNGTYVFGNTQPNYINDVTSLKQGSTTIKRVESCIGGWGSTSYDNIKALVNSQGTGSTSILYKNFLALKNAIPSMDAINNDDEKTYDVNSATAFHVMLKDLGYKTTLAPYMNKPYWQSLATNINNQRANAVDRIYLQWYDGGASNNPCDWNINGIELHTGDLNYENAATISNKMNTAKGCGSKGGFIWVYNDNNINLLSLAQGIYNIYGGDPVPTTNVVTVYKDCGYAGFSGGLTPGDYNLAQLNSLGILDNDLSSLKITQGYKATLYQDDNFGGTSTVISSDNTCLNSTWNDKVSSIKIRTNGTTGLGNITYYLQNRHSGLYMDVWGQSTADGGNIAQGSYTGASNQKFKLIDAGDGAYQIQSISSGKVLDIAGVSVDNGANVHQWGYVGAANQQFIAVSTGDGYYKLVAKHSGKLVEAAGFSTVSGGNVQQWENGNQASGHWKLIPAGTAKSSKDLLKTEAEAETVSLNVYPNPVENTLFFTNEMTGTQVSIFSAAGSLVSEQKVMDNSLDVSSLAAGIYFVVFDKDGTKMTKRFIKK
jgi:hypothetical protein